MRILAQLQALDDALEAWERYRQIPFEKFVQEKDVRYMVCHAMLLAIQSAIDIATGIAVMKTPKRPDTYRETFLLLGRSSLIPEELASELSHARGIPKPPGPRVYRARYWACVPVFTGKLADAGGVSGHYQGLSEREPISDLHWTNSRSFQPSRSQQPV